MNPSWSWLAGPPVSVLGVMAVGALGTVVAIARSQGRSVRAQIQAQTGRLAQSEVDPGGRRWEPAGHRPDAVQAAPAVAAAPVMALG